MVSVETIGSIFLKVFKLVSKMFGIPHTKNHSATKVCGEENKTTICRMKKWQLIL